MQSWLVWITLLDEGVLEHIMSGVLPETKLWEELQDQDCRILAEFYRKASKHL